MLFLAFAQVKVVRLQSLKAEETTQRLRKDHTATEQIGPLPAARNSLGQAEGHREPTVVRNYFFFVAAACSRSSTLKSSALNGK